MKILHIIFPFEYIEGWGYQENLLPSIQSKMGYDVFILTGNIVDRAGIKEKFDEQQYINDDNVQVTRIGIRKAPYILQKKLHLFKNFYNYLCELEPDLIFLHDPDGPSNRVILKYKKNHPKVKIVADSHTDYVNSAHGWISKHILHEAIHRYYYSLISPVCIKIYGTLPMRCDFIEDVYKIPSYKVDYLPMGFDDTNIDFDKKELIRLHVREELGIDKSDFVIITGGKLEKRKNIIELINAIIMLNRNDVKLIVFGEPSSDICDEFEALLINKCIISLGWIDSKEIYKYYFASDLAAFVGTHSVLWEQAIACGLPCVFKTWNGISHLDLGGNCSFLEKNDTLSIKNHLESLIDDKELLVSMSSVANLKGRKIFAYTEICKKILKDCDLI